MTDSNDPQPQPEHVVNAATVGGTIGALVAAGGMYFVFFGVTSSARVQEFSRITAVFVSCAVAAIVFLAPYVAALRARNKVTPITPKATPRDAQGRRLVPVEEYGRHAKKTPPPPATLQHGVERLRDRYGPDPDDDRDVEEFVSQIRTSKEPHVTSNIHPTRKLGKRPTDPNRPVLKMGAHFTAAAFQAPTEVDYASKVPSWLLGANDRFGTCGPTSVANLALLVSTLLADAPVQFTDDEIFDLYRRSGNPGFDPATGVGDAGVDMTVMLAELVKNGIGKGDRNIRAVAFGSVDPHDTAKLWAAGCLFGGVLWGADLDVAQQAQTDAGLWDYKRSGTWGGHAILSAPAYSDQPGTLADRTKLVTWAELIAATDTFIEHQVSECYVVLFPWHLGDKRIYEALDMQGVADEYTQLTGRPFPAPVQPPAPEPPAPAPGPAPKVLPADVTAWAGQVVGEHWRSGKDRRIAREILDFAGGAR